MRALAVLAALALTAPAPGAHADEGHLLTAECRAVGFLTTSWSVVATARAEGHARVVSTEVVCTTEPGYGAPGSFRQAVPGPVAVAAGIADSEPLWGPYVCVQATAYWSDGHVLATDTGCWYGAASVQVSS